MSGARLSSYRLGDRSELLVEHLLAGIAYTTRVPRQEDIGIDFLCSLITGHGTRLLKAGPFFAVQSKSSTAAIAYKKPYELEWIRNQENPLLVCVANRRKARMDVYSTWNLLCGTLGGGQGGTITPTSIRLRPGKTAGWPGIQDGPEGSQEILLGKPIVQISHDDVFDESKTASIAEVLGVWVNLDRFNIANRRAGLNWVLGPEHYETGRLFDPNQMRVSFYWYPGNLEMCKRNLGLSATGLWRVLHHKQISTEADLTEPPWPDGIKALQEMLQWCRTVQPELQHFLRDLDGNPET